MSGGISPLRTSGQAVSLLYSFLTAFQNARHPLPLIVEPSLPFAAFVIICAFDEAVFFVCALSPAFGARIVFQVFVQLLFSFAVNRAESDKMKDQIESVTSPVKPSDPRLHLNRQTDD